LRATKSKHGGRRGGPGYVFILLLVVATLVEIAGQGVLHTVEFINERHVFVETVVGRHARCRRRTGSATA
jgi:hypothetical protein